MKKPGREKTLTSRIRGPLRVILQPAMANLSTRDSKCLGITGDKEIQDRVMAAAIMNVPASIRSGIMVNSQPCNCFLPVITIVLVPAPSMHAPLAIRNSARSKTSGSCPTIIQLKFSNLKMRNNRILDP